MARGRPATPAETRFLAKVAKGDACWEWTGYVDQKGYGVFGISNTQLVKAHRFSYELHVGPVPQGMQLDHLCRVRHCVNPKHLEPVTNRENVIRGNQARGAASHCKRGHPMDGANTYIHPQRGKRHCRACQTERAKRWRVAE